MNTPFILQEDILSDEIPIPGVIKTGLSNRLVIPCYLAKSFNTIDLADHFHYCRGDQFFPRFPGKHPPPDFSAAMGSPSYIAGEFTWIPASTE